MKAPRRHQQKPPGPASKATALKYTACKITSAKYFVLPKHILQVPADPPSFVSFSSLVPPFVSTFFLLKTV